MGSRRALPRLQPVRGEVRRQWPREDAGRAARVPPQVLPARSARLPAPSLRRGFPAAAADGDFVAVALAAWRKLHRLPHREEGLLVPADGGKGQAATRRSRALTRARISSGVAAWRRR